MLIQPLSEVTVNVTLKELKILWDKQEGKCAITKTVLIPGINVALDHIIPKTQNGNNDIDNLRFIHYNINLMKFNLTDIEFKTILKDILPNLLEWSKEK